MRMPDRGVRDREATSAVGRGGPHPDSGRADMPTRCSGTGVPTVGASGKIPYGLTATPAKAKNA